MYVIAYAHTHTHTHTHTLEMSFSDTILWCNIIWSYNLNKSLTFCFYGVNLSESGELENLEKYLT